MTYWPWWIGAAALGAMPVVFWLLLRKPLGVSGSWGQVTGWRRAAMARSAEAAFASSPGVMQDALMAATVRQFGKDAAMRTLATGALPTRPVSRKVPTRAPAGAHLMFLLALGLGGFLSLPLADMHLSLSMGPTFAGFFGNGWRAWAVLAGGGVMVGFGTQMAGGCTSGHGLAGCAHLRPASWLATAVFFGGAVGTSMLLEAFLK